MKEPPIGKECKAILHMENNSKMVVTTREVGNESKVVVATRELIGDQLVMVIYFCLLLFDLLCGTNNLNPYVFRRLKLTVLQLNVTLIEFK